MKTMNYLAIIGLSVMLVACSGTKSPKVASMQKTDKQLNCSQVQLEINEAEFYRKQALENKNPGFGSVIAPISYISTYVDAGKAQVAADDRIDYLNRIYEINRCDEPQGYAALQPQPAPFVPAPILDPAAYAPMPQQYGAGYGVPAHVARPQNPFAPYQAGYAGQYAYASPIAYQPSSHDYSYSY